jgi:uncharacterized protein YndB with AHSA1/START domain
MKTVVSTVIAAPLSEVWRLYNAPEHIKIWNTASQDWQTTASTVDLQVGGTFSSRMEAKKRSNVRDGRLFSITLAGTY